MSVASMVFNRGNLKLLLALAIPGVIGGFFIYAEHEAQRQINEVKGVMREHPLAEELNIENYEMKEVDDTNNVRWQLHSTQGKLHPNGQDVDLKGVTVEFYDKETKALKMRLKAPVGTANQETKFVKLNTDGHTKVYAEGEGGKNKFQCWHVELDKSNRFKATGDVIIEWPGIAKVSGDSAKGSVNMAAGPKDFQVFGNTHAEIAVR
jgi:hypothetical protein